jgi:hypothetical protein
LAAANRSLVIRARERLNQLVADPLMVAFAMIVGDELGNRVVVHEADEPDQTKPS